MKSRKYVMYYVAFAAAIFFLMHPITLNAGIGEMEIEYIDVDTNAVIYYGTVRNEVAAKHDFIHQPPYIFQNEAGEYYTLDTGNSRNDFMVVPGERLPYRAFYKKGVPEEGRTAVKIRMFSRKSDKIKLIDVRYIDNLLEGSSFAYQPDLEFASGNDVAKEEYHVFNEGDADNQLEIAALNKDMDKNVINAYYAVKQYVVYSQIEFCYYDFVTGKRLKTYMDTRRGTEPFKMTPETVFVAENGMVYIFDGEAPGNILNSFQLTDENQNHLSAYYRQQIKIRFDAGGGQCTVDMGTFQRGLSIGALPLPTREGYLFTGWFTSETGGLQIKDDAIVDFDKDQTLYAGWAKQDEISKPDGDKGGDPPSGSLKQVTITKTVNKKNGSLQLKWKKVSNAEGYELCYAKNKKFKKAERKETRQCNIMLKKLKKGSTYYVKVRAYRYDLEGQKVYGKYSKKKKVTIRQAKG